MGYEFLFVCDEFQGDYTQPKCGGKQVVVHLFEWSWDSIARECEEVTKSWEDFLKKVPNLTVIRDRSWDRRGTAACRCPRPRSTFRETLGGPGTSPSPTSSPPDLATGEYNTMLVTMGNSWSQTF